MPGVTQPVFLQIPAFLPARRRDRVFLPRSYFRLGNGHYHVGITEVHFELAFRLRRFHPDAVRVERQRQRVGLCHIRPYFQKLVFLIITNFCREVCGKLCHFFLRISA